MPGLSLGTCLSNLKSVALTVLELLAFNAENLGGRVTLATSLFEKFLRGHDHTVLETYMSNLKSVALTILNWSFNAQKN